MVANYGRFGVISTEAPNQQQTEILKYFYKSFQIIDNSQQQQ